MKEKIEDVLLSNSHIPRAAENMLLFIGYTVLELMEKIGRRYTLHEMVEDLGLEIKDAEEIYLKFKEKK